jgi:hypothetical protein
MLKRGVFTPQRLSSGEAGGGREYGETIVPVDKNCFSTRAQMGAYIAKCCKHNVHIVKNKKAKAGFL